MKSYLSSKWCKGSSEVIVMFMNLRNLFFTNSTSAVIPKRSKFRRSSWRSSYVRWTYSFREVLGLMRIVSKDAVAEIEPTVEEARMA